MAKLGILTTPNADKDMQHQKFSFITDGNAKMVQLLWKDVSLAVSYKTDRILTL